jgi:hypothetical protein
MGLKYRPQKWGEGHDPARTTRSGGGFGGRPQPEGLIQKKVHEFEEHGAGTRASFTWSFKYYWKALYDLCVVCDHTRVQSGRWNGLVITGVYGYIVTALAGVPVRIFTRNSFLTPFACMFIALMFGFLSNSCSGSWTWVAPDVTPPQQQIAAYMQTSTCPQEIVMTNLADGFQTLTNFVLGLYVSNVIAKIYYAQRSMLGDSFGGILGFCMRLLSSVKPLELDDQAGSAPVLPENVKRAQKRMIRWTNAIFRLLWLESCQYDEQITNNMEVMTGALGPLLTRNEWERIKSVPSRVTHIIYWINTCVDDLKKTGYLDPMSANELGNTLNTLRSSNNYGLSSLPYPYVYAIISMTKLFIIFRTFQQGFSMALVVEASDKLNGWNDDRRWIMFVECLEIWFTVWIYQALLDLYMLLRNPNQGKLAGHMPVPDFLQFTEAVTYEMLQTQETAPRPLFADESDDDESEIQVTMGKTVNPLSGGKASPRGKGDQEPQRSAKGN